MKFSELLKESKAADLIGFKLDQAELEVISAIIEKDTSWGRR